MLAPGEELTGNRITVMTAATDKTRKETLQHDQQNCSLHSTVHCWLLDRQNHVHCETHDFFNHRWTTTWTCTSRNSPIYFCIMAKKNKERLNVVYSTNPNFNYEVESEEEQNTLAPQFQKLYVSIDKKQRAGKEVTLVEGFIGAEEDLKELGKLLKSKCGVGGTVKENEILIQGNFRDKIMEILIKEGYQVKRKGG